MSRKKIHKWLQEALLAQKQGDITKASTLYREVLKSDPKNADALHLSGVIAYQSGNLKEAIKLVNSAVRQNSQEASFWNTLGLIKRTQGDGASAVNCYQRAIQIDSRFLEAWSNMGVAWNYLGVNDKANACYQKALEINPHHVSTLKNLAQLLNSLKQYADAARIYEATLKLAPNDYEVISGLAVARLEICDWQDLPSQCEQIESVIRSGYKAFIPPWIYLSFSTSPELQLLCAQAWSHRFMDSLEKTAVIPDRSDLKSSKEKLHIAYWSADFREHAVSQQLAEVIELHDRDLFTVTLLSYGPDDESAMRQRLITAADHFIDIRDRSYDEVVSIIRESGIDILIDLMGYTGQTRSYMLALRPAPIQVAWLGYAGTMGTAHVDYILSDEFVVPIEMEEFYIEKIARLPNSYQPVDRKRQVGDALGRHDYGLPESGIVFCSFNRSSKIMPDMFHTWMRILMRVPLSVLWLPSAGVEMESNLRKEAEKCGIAPERLVFAPIVPLPQHRARYKMADLMLDTFPYNSHATATDSLWGGCPIVTMAGDTFASRVSGSQLRAVKMPELITYSYSEYEELAVTLAMNPDRLQTLRNQLEEGRDTLPLFDTPAFTRGLEDTYRKMVVEHAKP